jgi:hypothetical protein
MLRSNTQTQKHEVTAAAHLLSDNSEEVEEAVMITARA